MPPKAKTAFIPTDTEINDIKSRLDKEPTEDDFNKVIAGANGDEAIKSKVARIIPIFIKQLPKCEDAALNALKTLALDESEEVAIYALKGLKDYINATDKAVYSTVYKALNSENERVAEEAYKHISEAIKADEDFKNVFLSHIKDQDDKAQVYMIRIARENYKFTEENVDELIGLIEVCFDSSVENGLKFLRFNKKIITEEKKEPLVTKLLENLEASLVSDFENVTGSLLTLIMNYIPSLGQAGKILDLVATKVLPKFEDIAIENKIRIIQLIADNAKDAQDPALLENLYNNVYLTFPKAYDNDKKVNFTLLEATLFAFFRLGRRFSKKASELTGELLVITGQPNENEGVTESAEKKEEFLAHIKNVDAIAEKFVSYWKGIDEGNKELAETKTLEERKKEHREAKIAIRTGNNVLHFCRILQRENFISQNPPKDVSWRKPAHKETKNIRKDNKSGRMDSKFARKDRKVAHRDERRGGREAERHGHRDERHRHYERRSGSRSYRN